MKLEEKLVSLRKAKGLSQLTLADMMNVSRQAISRWEVGAAVPSIENLRFLSRLYGVSIDYLVNEESKDPVPSEEAFEGNRRSGSRIEQNAENDGAPVNDCRKTWIWLLIGSIIAVGLIAFGVFTHSIAISLIVSITTGIITIIYLLVRWILHIVMRVKTNKGGDKEK